MQGPESGSVGGGGGQSSGEQVRQMLRQRWGRGWPNGRQSFTGAWTSASQAGRYTSTSQQRVDCKFGEIVLGNALFPYVLVSQVSFRETFVLWFSENDSFEFSKLA